MRGFIRAAVAALAVLAVLVGTGVAGAEPAGGQSYSQAELAALQARVDENLGLYGGGKQIGINQVEYLGGTLLLTLKLPGERSARAVQEPVGTAGVANCQYQWVCLWTDTHFNGDRLAKYACQTITVPQMFQDNTGSVHNNQTTNTETVLYNSGWSVLNANLAPTRISDTGVNVRWVTRYWKTC
ncbi:peptidase inhibitor family I36 protein [Actinosynnema sp. NPDC023587]|uniref:peptidase inhibitor family I36 protein n=1 Tax=Actinosynnema sp. NPDC023587 TaxID=3154695 RepID=UPI0033F34327